MKAIIPVAGYGTRMLPITKSVPKELLPVGNKPVIQYIVEGLVNVGIKNICMVTSQGKGSIEDYFDKNYELEEQLAKKGKLELLEEVNKPKNLANICFVKQKEQLGFAHAVSFAEPWMSGDYFILVVGDQIYSPQIFQDMLDIYRQYKSPVLLLQEIPIEEVYKYGVVKMKDGKIIDIVEKPKPGTAPSNLYIPGMYILPIETFEYIKKTPMDTEKGEILLTDTLKMLMKKYDFIPCITKHKIWDLGNPQDWLKANVEIFESSLF